MPSQKTIAGIPDAPSTTPTTTQSITDALKRFQGSLTNDQKRAFLQLPNQLSPDGNSVLAFTAEIGASTQRQTSRCVASRLQGVLESVREYTCIVDTFVNSNPTAVVALNRTGWLSVARSLLVPFEKEFGQYTDTLRLRSQDVDAEIKLAFYQEARYEQNMQNTERKQTAQHRAAFRLLASKVEESSRE
ncbi:hypothetical protein ACLMJK_003598 [Lecanora helva]